jgi:lysozyme family protein
MGAAGAPKREMTMAMLRLGSTGNEVKKLQEGLNKALKPSPKLKPDGQFGPGTDKAVRQFQKKNKLKPDGVVGPKTMAMIDGGGKQVEMDIFDYREKKKKIEGVMKGNDKNAELNTAASKEIPAIFARMMKNFKTIESTWGKADKEIDAMCAKWYTVADQMIKLQDAFKAAAKTGDGGKQQKIKQAIDKLHPQGEKLRKGMEGKLGGAGPAVMKKQDEIIKDANYIVELMTKTS